MIRDMCDFEFLVGKIWDSRETVKSPIVWDFPDIWKPGLRVTCRVYLCFKSTLFPYENSWRLHSWGGWEGDFSIMAYTGRPSPNRDIFSSNTLTKLIARLIRHLMAIYLFCLFRLYWGNYVEGISKYKIISSRIYENRTSWLPSRPQSLSWPK